MTSSEGAWRHRSRVVRGWRLWRTRRPVTFNDKVRYKMLRDHGPLQVRFADKAAMREHVAEVVGEQHLPRLLLLTKDPSDLLCVELPEGYVVKPTHGSGACILVDPAAPALARLPPVADGWAYRHVQPRRAPREDVAAVAGGWLTRLYGGGPNHEWAYGRAVRRLLVEELLVAPGGGIPIDYKLYVFHGRCRFVHVVAARFLRRTSDYMDPDWQRVDVSGRFPRSEAPPARPERLAEMVQLAEQLGDGTDFVRVDLYCLPERVVVGELTTSPAAGDLHFDPSSWHTEFGRTWTVPRRYR